MLKSAKVVLVVNLAFVFFLSTFAYAGKGKKRKQFENEQQSSEIVLSYDQLPTELKSLIFGFLDYRTLGTLLAVNRESNALSSYLLNQNRIGKYRSIEIPFEYDLRFVSFSPDGSTVFTAAENKVARAWGASDGKLVAEIEFFSKDAASDDQRLTDTKWLGVRLAEFSPRSDRVVIANRAYVGVFDTRSGQLVSELKPPVVARPSAVQFAEFSRDGSRILTSTELGQTRVWDTETGKLLDEVEELAPLAFSSIGDHILFLDPLESAYTVFPVSDRSKSKVLGKLDGASIASFSPDGKQIAIASSPIRDDDQELIEGSDHGTLTVFDTQTAELIFKRNAHVGEIYSLAYSPDGERIVTSSFDQTSVLWNAVNGNVIARLNGHHEVVRKAVFSSDGARILTISADKTARIWNGFNGKLMAVLKGHQEGLFGQARFSVNGNHVLTSDRGAIRVWEFVPNLGVRSKSID